MPTPTYTPLGTITLASTDSEIVFSSIPATYRDLILVVSAGNSGNVYNGLWSRINGDSTSSNYSSVYALGNGSSAISGTSSGDSGRLMTGATGASGSATIIQFLDYSATDKHKTVLTRRGVSDASGYSMGMEAARWASNSAITSIALSDQSSYSFDIGSTFALYGIAG